MIRADHSHTPIRLALVVTEFEMACCSAHGPYGPLREGCVTGVTLAAQPGLCPRSKDIGPVRIVAMYASYWESLRAGEDICIFFL